MADKYNKRKHETLSLAKKVEILRKLDSGQKKVDLAQEYNVGRATVYDIAKNREKIEHFVTTAGMNASARHTLKDCEYHLMEDVLYSWFLEERRHNKTLTEKTVQKKSLHFYKEIYKNDNFKASDGWFRKFKTRYGIRGLYDPVTKKAAKLSKRSKSSEPNDEEHVTPSESVLKSEGSGSNIGNIVPKQEPLDEAADVSQSEDFTWPGLRTENTTTDEDSRSSSEKKEVNIEYDDSTWEDESSLFVAHLKTRMDKLNHQQRFIAQKLMSDVMMLAETNQLQLTSAIVDRALSQNRHKPGKGNDPLEIN